MPGFIATKEKKMLKRNIKNLKNQKGKPKDGENVQIVYEVTYVFANGTLHEVNRNRINDGVVINGALINRTITNLEGR